MRRRARAAFLTIAVVLLLTACTGPSGDVGFLDVASGQSPAEAGVASATLSPRTAGANLLVAIAMGDGPGPGEANAERQHSRIRDTAGHVWTLRDHHVVYGSIIDVYTAPATGREPGSTVSSDMVIKEPDEGHSLSVVAYRNGRVDAITSHNGNFGVAQSPLDAPAGADVLTAFVDGRDNRPATPVAGFRPVDVLRVDGTPRGDQDLYQLSRLDPPGSWRGGTLLTGNAAPPPSGFWGLVDVVVSPAS